MKYEPHPYQRMAEEHIYRTPRCGLFLEMGLGKTVVALTALAELMFDRFEVGKALVIAPLRVAEDTWGRECEKWDHLKHLRLSLILGTPTQRRKALAREADIYIINRENVVWLANELSGLGGGWDFDAVVIDELSSFKSAKSQRFRALRKMIPKSRRVIGLTGTPAPNGLMDLWSEIYLLDGGERLGKTLTAYREKYFTPGKRNQTTIFTYLPKAGAVAAIQKKISDICISMQAADWLTLPERLDVTRAVVLSAEERAAYEAFEREQYFQFLEGAVMAASAAALTGKLLQFANGALYLEEGGWVKTSEKKLDALGEILEGAQGKPVLCFYSYRHDLERILARFPQGKKLTGSQEIAAWNEQKIPLLLAHPASAGHGLNLQAGGHIIVWFGLPWSLELYEQANARLYRQGQKESVIIHHLVAEGTADERVMESLQGKHDVQQSLMAALKAKYEGGGKHR